jgi:transposase-like protein
MRCGRTYRHYPVGVSQAEQSQALQGMSVLLYVLGLSYGAVSDFLGALGVFISKTTVYRNVQAAGVASRQQGRSAQTRPVIGADGTYVKVKGVKVGLQVVIDDASGELLGLELVSSENPTEMLDILREVAQEVGAEVLVSDDLDAYKEVADELGLDHQICRKHVKDNVDALVDELRLQIQRTEAVPEAADLTPEILGMDLAYIQWLVWVRPPDALQHLQRLYQRYKIVPRPPAGHKHSVWYRTRQLITRLWDKWARLTLDQQRDDLDGTNNACERLIGWWIKERYRTMRGYKRAESILNVVTLTAQMGVHSGHYDMGVLYA